MGRTRNKQSQGANTPVSQALIQQRRSFVKWDQIVQSLALGRFKWNNVPETVDARFLEWTLLLNGEAVFFELNGDLMATRVIRQGYPDVYDNIHEYAAIGSNGFNYQIPKDEGVVIYDNLARRNSYEVLYDYIDNLAEIDTLQRANRRQQRNMVVFSGPAESKDDLVRIARDLEMNESLRVVSNNFKQNVNVEALSTNVQYKQKDFHEDRTATLNSLYLYLGIEHIGFEKSAHLLESEASISSDSVARMRENFLKARYDAAEAVNNKFGTNITVEWNTDQLEIMSAGDKNKGAESNGNKEI